MALLETLGAAHAAGLHAGVEREDVEAVLLGVHEVLDFKMDQAQFGWSEPSFKDRFLTAYFVIGENLSDFSQATGVAHVVGDEVEGAVLVHG